MAGLTLLQKKKLILIGFLASLSAGFFGALILLKIRSILKKKNESTKQKRSDLLRMDRAKINAWHGKNLESISLLKLNEIVTLFEVALDIKENYEEKPHLFWSIAKGKILAILFFEPSTRTRLSFMAAMHKLGGTAISMGDIQKSSIKKGESLRDTIKCLGRYSNGIVIRHPVEGSANVAIKALKEDDSSSCVIMNGGDGIGEHPSQALLDLFTIFQCVPSHSLNGLKIAFCGDLKNGRTVHSLFRLFLLFAPTLSQPITLYLVSPQSLTMPMSLINLNQSSKRFIKIIPKRALTFNGDLSNSWIASLDCLYMTRIQKERFTNESDYLQCKDSYQIDSSFLGKCKESMILMHPLPRINEIREECDMDKRAKYFFQMQMGLYVRMALIALQMGLY